MKNRILYVEDDNDLAYITKDQLELEGYEVHHFVDGMAAFKSIGPNKYDLCLLDVMLPNMDGYSLAQKIRSLNVHIPIIFLTAKSMEEDRIEGFESGGDDYIIKPYSLSELNYKIKVFLKRNVVQQHLDQPIYEIGRFRFSPAELTLEYENKKKILTAREAEVLTQLTKDLNKLVKREDILSIVWGKNDYFLGRSLDVFISRLRKYLKDDPSIKIENVHGVGFKLIVHK